MSMSSENKPLTKLSWLSSEDWWAAWLGLFIFFLSLGPIFGKDLLGWVTKTNTWIALGKSVSTVSSNYADMSGFMSLLFTYLFLLAITCIGTYVMGGKCKKIRFRLHHNFCYYNPLHYPGQIRLYCSNP